MSPNLSYGTYGKMREPTGKRSAEVKGGAYIFDSDSEMENFKDGISISAVQSESESSESKNGNAGNTKYCKDISFDGIHITPIEKSKVHVKTMSRRKKKSDRVSNKSSAWLFCGNLYTNR